MGTRMKPATEKFPKSLIPVNGRPFLHYQLEWLRAQGATRVTLCIGHMGDKIRADAADGRAWELAIDYAEEGESLQGTAGALRLAADAGKLEERFLILYGDSFLPFDAAPFWRQFVQGKFPAAMTVLKNEGKWDKSNLRFDGERIILYDKKCPDPRAQGLDFIDYGLSAFSRTLVEREIPPGRVMDLADVYHALSLRGELGGFEVHERFFEVGSLSGLADFEAYVQTHSLKTPSP